MGQFLAETKAHKCALSPAGVSEDCLVYHLSTHSVCAQSLHGDHILWLFRTYTQSLKLELVSFVSQGSFYVVLLIMMDRYIYLTLRISYMLFMGI